MGPTADCNFASYMLDYKLYAGGELVYICRLFLTCLDNLYAGAHKDVVRGVRWLGPTARIVSFSSEKAAHGYRNTLLLTDIRNRSSLPFREVGAEGSPMLGIRASPLGRYILILLRGAPSEIWAVSQHHPLSTLFLI